MKSRKRLIKRCQISIQKTDPKFAKTNKYTYNKIVF